MAYTPRTIHKSQTLKDFVVKFVQTLEGQRVAIEWTFDSTAAKIQCMESGSTLEEALRRFCEVHTDTERYTLGFTYVDGEEED